MYLLVYIFVSKLIYAKLQFIYSYIQACVYEKNHCVFVDADSFENLKTKIFSVSFTKCENVFIFKILSKK